MSIKDLQVDQQPIEVIKLMSTMQEIEQELLIKTPNLPRALIDLHKNLMEHEELVHLMSDEDIAAVHQAHEIHKQITLVMKDEKKAATRGRKKLTNNDLSNL